MRLVSRAQIGVIKAVDNGSLASGRIYVCRSDREYLPVMCRSKIVRCKIIRILVYERNIGVQTRTNNLIKGCTRIRMLKYQETTINHEQSEICTHVQQISQQFKHFLHILFLIKISPRLYINASIFSLFHSI